MLWTDASADGARDAGAVDASDEEEPDGTVPTSLEPLDFSFVGCGTTVIATVVVPNTGPAPLAMHAETTGAPFAVTPTDLTVDAGASAAFTVSAAVPLSATAGSPIRGMLALTTSGPQAARTDIELSVTPNGATLTFEPDLPTEANFGAWPLGVAANPARLVLKNTGNEPVGVTIGSPANPVFTLATQPAVPTTIDSIGAGWPSVLPVNQDSMTLTLDVGFTPAALGPYSSTLPITTTGTICGGSVTAIPVSGEGMIAGVYGWPEPDFNLGDTNCGATPSGTFTITNSLNRDVTLTSVTFDKAGYTASAAAGTTVPAQGQLDITVTGLPIPFPSPIPAVYASTLAIATDVAGDEVHSIVVFAHPLGAILEVIPSSPTFGTFGPSPYGAVMTQTFELRNVGNLVAVYGTTETAAFGGIGTNSEPPQGAGAPNGFGAGFTMSSSITFQPTSAQEVTGSLSFSTSTPGSYCQPLPGPFALAGSGYANGITVSPTSLVGLTDCAGDPPGPAQLVITNVGFSNATWTATTTPGFVLDVTTSTLTPGQSVTVAVSLPKPVAPPTTVNVAQGQVTIEAVFAGDAGLNSEDGGPSSQMIAVPVFEAVDGCFVMDAPTGPVDFGNVPLDTSGQLTVLKPREACGNGMGSSQLTELGNDSLSAFAIEEQRSVGHDEN